MKVIWLPRTCGNLENIYQHVAEDNPSAAAGVVARLYEAGIRLGIPALARRGRKGRVPGTRELIVPKTSCLIAYRIGENQIEILAVVRGKQKWAVSF